MSLLGKILGRKGEDRAATFLTQRGYRILERNYRIRAGEIDLVALHGDTVVFVEVKTRSNEAYGAPELAVTPRKQQRMIKAALAFIKQHRFHQVPCRFDVVAVHAGPKPDIELIQNAFEMDRTYL